VPFFHATGCFAIMIPSMMTGNKIVMQRRWDCDQALPLMAKERVTHFGGVPTIAWQVLEHPKVDEYDLSSDRRRVLWRRAGCARIGEPHQSALPDRTRPARAGA
jgi:acyl-CoA synthetase (AMP-forming)/AMP-acid ligase II